MQKLLNLWRTEKINFPNFIHKKVLNKNLLIAPEYPTWIVLDDDEYDMFQSVIVNIQSKISCYLQKKYTRTRSLFYKNECA